MQTKGDTMPGNIQAFAIDDTLSTSDNLIAYAQLLGAMDAPLGAALARFLASSSTGQPIDIAAIWDALYAATAPADSDPTP
jgi:hypothetical protein